MLRGLWMSWECLDVFGDSKALDTLACDNSIATMFEGLKLRVPPSAALASQIIPKSFQHVLHKHWGGHYTPEFGWTVQVGKHAESQITMDNHIRNKNHGGPVSCSLESKKTLISSADFTWKSMMPDDRHVSMFKRWTSLQTHSNCAKWWKVVSLNVPKTWLQRSINHGVECQTWTFH